jgi:hypothetical protein
MWQWGKLCIQNQQHCNGQCSASYPHISLRESLHVSNACFTCCPWCRGYIISMLWATATSLVIHNSGLPPGRDCVHTLHVQCTTCQLMSRTLSLTFPTLCCGTAASLLALPSIRRLALSAITYRTPY